MAKRLALIAACLFAAQLAFAQIPGTYAPIPLYGSLNCVAPLNCSTSGYVITITTSGGGAGSVTSVALTAPSVFSVGGSPITTSGTLALTFAGGQTANQVLASPNGSSGAVALRALVGADIPAINLGTSGNGGVTGNLPIGNLNAQGTDTNVLTAGTISGTSSPLCTDANGGATTVSCPTNALTMNNGGSGASSGSTFNGSAPVTLSYNTIGAAPNPVPLTDMATQSANTVLGNFTSSTAAPTATAVATCSGNNDGEIYTLGTGFGCGTNFAQLNVTETFTSLNTFSNEVTFSHAGTSGVPGINISGAPFTGGTGTTTVPQAAISSGSAVGTWSTSGTELGTNAPSGFVGNIYDDHVNGGASVRSLNYLGEERNANSCRPTSAITLTPGTPVTVCSWSLPGVAQTWSWQCSGIYSLTAGTSPTLKIEMNASQTPTSETGSASIMSTLTGTSTQATVTATSTGNQVILTGTTNTQANAQFTTFGTLQSSGSAGTFAITADEGGTGSPAGTVNVGTTCILY